MGWEIYERCWLRWLAGSVLVFRIVNARGYFSLAKKIKAISCDAILFMACSYRISINFQKIYIRGVSVITVNFSTK